MLEELLDAVDDTDSETQEAMTELSKSEGIMTIGSEVSKQAPTRKTMRLCGKVGALDIMILVDSGSVGSFISSQLADQLTDQL